MSSNWFCIDEKITDEVRKDWSNLILEERKKISIKMENCTEDICNNKFLEIEFLNIKEGIVKVSLYTGNGNSSSVVLKNNTVTLDLAIDNLLREVARIREVKKMCTNNKCYIIADGRLDNYRDTVISVYEYDESRDMIIAHEYRDVRDPFDGMKKITPTLTVDKDQVPQFIPPYQHPTYSTNWQCPIQPPIDAPKKHNQYCNDSTIEEQTSSTKTPMGVSIPAGTIPLYSPDGRMLVGPENCTDEYLNCKHTILTLMKAGVNIDTKIIDYLKDAEEKSPYDLEKVEVSRIRKCAEDAIIQFQKDRLFFVQYSGENGLNELTPELKDKWRNTKLPRNCKFGKKIAIEIPVNGKLLTLYAEFRNCSKEECPWNEEDNYELVLSFRYDLKQFFYDVVIDEKQLNELESDVYEMVKYMCISSTGSLRNYLGLAVRLNGDKLEIVR